MPGVSADPIHSRNSPGSSPPSDGERISREAEPGDTVQFKITFLNNYTKDEDLDIEDVTAELTIEGIDDGSDMDEESKEFDVRADDDKTVTVEFDIPIEVEEDTFDVLINAEGDDENGTEHSVTWTVVLEVEKEDDKNSQTTKNAIYFRWTGGVPRLKVSIS